MSRVRIASRYEYVCSTQGEIFARGVNNKSSFQ